MSFWSFFPLNLKNLWIYKTAEKFSNEYFFTKVTINEKIPFSDKVIYILTYYFDDEEVKRESYVIQKDGIFLYAKKIENNLIVFDPMVPFLPYNFMDIDWWVWEGKVGFIKSKILFLNKKMVDQDTYKIVYTEENKFGKSEYNIFIKKNVGIIKEEAETPYMGYISELQDYTVSFDDFSFINFQEVYLLENDQELDMNLEEIQVEEFLDEDFSSDEFENQDIFNEDFYDREIEFEGDEKDEDS